MSLTFCRKLIYILLFFFCEISTFYWYLLLVSLLTHAEFREYLVDEIVFEFFTDDFAK